MAKERIEAVEPEKNLITFRVIEGDLLKEYKSFVITIHATPKQGGPGSTVHWHVEYEKIDEKVAHPWDLHWVLCSSFQRDRWTSPEWGLEKSVLFWCIYPIHICVLVYKSTINKEPCSKYIGDRCIKVLYSKCVDMFCLVLNF